MTPTHPKVINFCFTVDRVYFIWEISFCVRCDSENWREVVHSDDISQSNDPAGGENSA